MIGELDLQPGLQHLPDQAGQQPALPGQLHPLSAGPFDELLRPLPQRRPVRRRRARPLHGHQRRAIPLSCRHGHDPFQPTGLSRGPSDHAAYTKFLTDPRARHSMTGLATNPDMDMAVMEAPR